VPGPTDIAVISGPFSVVAGGANIVDICALNLGNYLGTTTPTLFISTGIHVSSSVYVGQYAQLVFQSTAPITANTITISSNVFVSHQSNGAAFNDAVTFSVISGPSAPRF